MAGSEFDDTDEFPDDDGDGPSAPESSRSDDGRLTMGPELAERLQKLFNEARSRPGDNISSCESNYSYVLSLLNEHEKPLLEEFYWSARPPQRRQVHGRSHQSKGLLTLMIDDDQFLAEDYGRPLTSLGMTVHYAFNVDDALRIADQLRGSISLIIIDIRMEFGDFLNSFETSHGRRTGVALADELRARAPDATLVALSHSVDHQDIAWFEAADGYFCNKNEYPPEKFLDFIRRKIMKDLSSLSTFIIHGHDKQAALDLKNYLQNTLQLSEPIILAEQPSNGMTMVEKLEYYLADADVVFAIFSPDDFATRARQNVVLEFGIVLGMFGRKSGRVIYLYKTGVEIPSDLNGVAYIDITNGVPSAGEQIRLELRQHLAS